MEIVYDCPTVDLSTIVETVYTTTPSSDISLRSQLIDVCVDRLPEVMENREFVETMNEHGLLASKLLNSEIRHRISHENTSQKLTEKEKMLKETKKKLVETEARLTDAQRNLETNKIPLVDKDRELDTIEQDLQETRDELRHAKTQSNRIFLVHVGQGKHSSKGRHTRPAIHPLFKPYRRLDSDARAV